MNPATPLSVMDGISVPGLVESVRLDAFRCSLFTFCVYVGLGRQA